MKLTPEEALQAIHALLDGQEWNANTMDAVASIVRQAGYIVRDPSDVDTTSHD